MERFDGEKELKAFFELTLSQIRPCKAFQTRPFMLALTSIQRQRSLELINCSFAVAEGHQDMTHVAYRTAQQFRRS